MRAPPAMTETFGELGDVRVEADAAGDRARVDIRPAGAPGLSGRGVKSSASSSVAVVCVRLVGATAAAPL